VLPKIYFTIAPRGSGPRGTTSVHRSRRILFADDSAVRASFCRSRRRGIVAFTGSVIGSRISLCDSRLTEF